MKNLKFSALAQNALNERKMNSLAGGNMCCCACNSNCSIDNGTANNAGNLNSKRDKDEDTGNGSIFLDPVDVPS